MEHHINSHRHSSRGATVVRISPDDNVLLGAATIKRYLRIRSWATLYRLVELYGLPAIKRPDGRWMSTVTAIDEWLFLAGEADAANRQHLRGSNERLEVAVERIKRRISSWDDFHGANKRRTEGVGGGAERSDEVGSEHPSDTLDYVKRDKE